MNDSQSIAAAMPRRVSLRRSLLGWFDRHRRVMPWRAEPGQRPNAYHVWLSEMMLQQTQVATVIPYFQRFIRTFPAIDDLAKADESQVLTLWQGLGYYRRARQLHAAAKAIVDRHDGAVPADIDLLKNLPGIGPYTAGAIASIAYGRPVPLVDGNVARVLARLFAIDEAVDQPAGRDRLWTIAASLVPKRRAGDFNQSLMELGSLVCRPTSPDCLICPCRGKCLALANRQVDELPRLTPKKPPVPVTHQVLTIVRGDRWLVRRRPVDGLWANLWEYPTSETQPLRSWIESHTGIALKRPSLRSMGRFTHLTSHRRITFAVWQARLDRIDSARELPPNWRWATLGEIGQLPMSNPQREIHRMVSEPAI